MTREIATTRDSDTDELPLDGEAQTASPPAAPKRPDKGKEKNEPQRDPDRERLGPDLKAVRAAEDLSIRELLESIGTAGSYRVKVRRKAPAESRDPLTGKMIGTAGFLATYEDVIDEQFLQDRHGGGTFELQVHRKSAKGSFVYFAQRSLQVAGEPNLEDPALRRIVAPVNAPAPTTIAPTESPTVVGKAFDVLAGQLQAIREDRDAGHREEVISPAVTAMLKMMGDTLEATRRELEETRKEARGVKPPEDPFKNELLSSLMREDNARLSSVRSQFESELRILKEHHISDIKRLEERHERYQSDTKQSHEREITNLRQSHEVSLAAIRSSYETQGKLLEHENRRLERDSAEERAELKELRAKHGKGIVEQVTELNKIKEALNIGDDEKEQGTVDKIMSVVTNPATMEFAQKFVGGRAPAAPAVQPQQLEQPRVPRFVQAPDGRKYRQLPNGSLIPVKEKRKVITTTNPDGTPGPELPAIPAETSAMVIGFLERALAAGTDPILVAQSYRAQVPDEIMTVIREHGVDLYLSKVAKLGGGSPLSTQAGRNWVRKVGEALVE